MLSRVHLANLSETVPMSNVAIVHGICSMKNSRKPTFKRKRNRQIVHRKIILSHIPRSWTRVIAINRSTYPATVAFGEGANNTIQATVGARNSSRHSIATHFATTTGKASSRSASLSCRRFWG